MEKENSAWGREARGIPENWPRNGVGEPELPVLLTNLPEGGVAAMTANMLQAYGIPVFQRYQDDGSFARVLFGGSAYGVGLFVPASRQEEARQLLEAVPGAEENTSDTTPPDAPADKK